MSHQPPQHQKEQPGVESQMTPRPKAEHPQYRGRDKLKNKVAIIMGGDSGIGRAIAIAFGKIDILELMQLLRAPGKKKIAPSYVFLA